MPRFISTSGRAGTAPHETSVAVVVRPPLGHEALIARVDSEDVAGTLG
jgi:hypothetical protein